VLIRHSINSALKIQCHFVKKTLLQTGISAILSTGLGNLHIVSFILLDRSVFSLFNEVMMLCCSAMHWAYASLSATIYFKHCTASFLSASLASFDFCERRKYRDQLNSWRYLASYSLTYLL